MNLPPDIARGSYKKFLAHFGAHIKKGEFPRRVLRMSDLGLIILLAILASIAFIVAALAIEYYHYRDR